MLGRYIKSQIMVLICGGLVGPIFLAVYFATGQSGLLKWMFWFAWNCRTKSASSSACRTMESAFRQTT